jgi:hypothetical protein
MNYIVTHRSPGSEGSHITKVKTYGRAVARARKFREEHKVPVGVWSDVSASYLLEIAADGSESKPAPTCPDSIRLKGLIARVAWAAKQGGAK